MPVDARVASAEVKKNGTVLPADQLENLIELRVQLDVNLPGRVSLRFADEQFAMFNEDLFKIGDKVEISLTDDAGQTATVAHAEVTELSVEQMPDGTCELQVSALDAGHKLARSAEPATYTNVTDADIYQKVASRHGLTGAISGSPRMIPYLIHGTDDYSLLSMLTRANGCDWWVDDTTLHVKPVETGQKVVTLELGEDLHRFKVRQSAMDNVTALTVRAWDPDQQKAIVGEASLDSNPGISTGAGVGSGTRTAVASFTSKRTVMNRPVPNQSAAEALATSTARRAIGQQVVARGEAVGNVSLKPGVSIEVKAVGAQITGVYSLTSVEHVFAAAQPLVTRFTSGGTDPVELVDMLGGGASARAWGQAGVVVGVVTNNSDADDYGRVKVKFPSFSDDDESTWARLAAPGASGGHGFHLLPEVGDEVVVAFEHGDANRPFVVGSLWSARKKPPAAKSVVLSGSDVVTRSWKSRTGHLIEMVDKPGSDAKVTIKLGDGSGTVTMTPEGITITTNGKLELEGKQGVTIKSDATVAVQANQAITIKSSADNVNIEAGMDMGLKANLDFTAQGMNASVKAQLNLDLEAELNAALKGIMVKLN